MRENGRFRQLSLQTHDSRWLLIILICTKFRRVRSLTIYVIDRLRCLNLWLFRPFQYAIVHLWIRSRRRYHIFFSEIFRLKKAAQPIDFLEYLVIPYIAQITTQVTLECAWVRKREIKQSIECLFASHTHFFLQLLCHKERLFISHLGR